VGGADGATGWRIKGEYMRRFVHEVWILHCVEKYIVIVS
jgi:hypothetical protein